MTLLETPSEEIWNRQKQLESFDARTGGSSNLLPLISLCSIYRRLSVRVISLIYALFGFATRTPANSCYSFG